MRESGKGITKLVTYFLAKYIKTKGATENTPKTKEYDIVVEHNIH